MCQKEYRTVTELCTYCKKKLKAANAPNSGGIESGLLSAFLEQRARQRQSTVKKLARKINPISKKTKATIESQKKQIRALRAILRKTKPKS